MILAAWDRTPPPQEDVREDARTVPPPAPQELERALGRMRVLLGRYLEVDDETGEKLARSARDVLRVNGAAHARLFAQVLGVDPFAGDDAWLEPLMEAHSQAMRRLITRVAPDEAARIGDIVRDHWHRGRTRKQLSEALVERVDITGRRAERIARDQIGKLNCGLNECRQVAAGIEEYTWRTANDRRVRELHQEREGQRFRWDDPPDDHAGDGHPGMPIQCRCRPAPVIPDADSLTPESERERALRVSEVSDRILLRSGIDPRSVPLPRVPSVPSALAVPIEQLLEDRMKATLERYERRHGAPPIEIPVTRVNGEDITDIDLLLPDRWVEEKAARDFDKDRSGTREQAIQDFLQNHVVDKVNRLIRIASEGAVARDHPDLDLGAIVSLRHIEYRLEGLDRDVRELVARTLRQLERQHPGWRLTLQE